MILNFGVLFLFAYNWLKDAPSKERPVFRLSESQQMKSAHLASSFSTMVMSLFTNLPSAHGLDFPIDSNLQDALMEKLSRSVESGQDNLQPRAVAEVGSTIGNFINPGSSLNLSPDHIRSFLQSVVSDARIVPILGGLAFLVDKVRYNSQLRLLSATQKLEIERLTREVADLSASLTKQTNYAALEEDVMRLNAELEGKREELQNLNQTLTSLIVNISGSGVGVQEGLVVSALRAEAQQLKALNTETNKQLSLSVDALKTERDRYSKVQQELTELRALLQQAQASQRTSKVCYVMDHTVQSKLLIAIHINVEQPAQDSTSTGTKSTSRVAMLRVVPGSARQNALTVSQLRREKKQDLVVALRAVNASLSTQELNKMSKDELIACLMK